MTAEVRSEPALPTDAANGPGGPFFVSLIALAFTMNALGRGVTESFAVFLLPVEAELGATRSEIAATYSIYMIVHGLAAPVAGQLVDRLGVRVTYMTGLVLLACANVLAGFADQIWHYYLTMGALSGMGAACLGMVVASALLSRWFTRGLGLMMAMPHAAVGAGMLIFPLVTQLLLDHYTWRETHWIIGYGVAWLLLLVLFLPVGRMSRGSREWRRDLRRSKAHGVQVWTASKAVRTPAFWALFGLYFFTSAAAYAILPHSVAFLVEQGFDKVLATGAFGMTGALSVAGILFMGWYSDRAGRLGAVTLSKVLTLSGIFSLIAINWYPSWILIYGFVLGFGLMQGARGPIIAALVSILFRGGSVGAIYGTLSLAFGLGAGLASWISGALYDATGTYLASFIFAAVASAAGLATYWISASLRAERPVAAV